MQTGTTLIRGADLVASPWKTGGGVTREVAAYPLGAALDAFVWRVSVADVAQAGPFSTAIAASSIVSLGWPCGQSFSWCQTVCFISGSLKAVCLSASLKMDSGLW